MAPAEPGWLIEHGLDNGRGGAGLGEGLPGGCSLPFPFPFPGIPVDLQGSTLDLLPPGRPPGHLHHTSSGLEIRDLPLLDSAWGWPLTSAQGSRGPGTHGIGEQTDPCPGFTGSAYSPIKDPCPVLTSCCEPPPWLELCCP